MSQKMQGQQVQQLETIMSTIFTCRGLVKYNLSLSKEQRSDLLLDIDAALEVLRAQLIENPSSNEDKVVSNIDPVPESTITTSPALPTNNAESASKGTLRSLYRMYYSYMDETKDTNIGLFVARFNDSMSIISDVEHALEGMYSGYSSMPAISAQLQKIRIFVSDIYYMLMEFIHSLSDILCENNTSLETEKHLVLQESPFLDYGRSAETDPSMVETSVSLLFRAYQLHQKLNKAKNCLSERVSEETAFLEFLKERISLVTDKREEIVIQLNTVIHLLADLFLLLSHYENAAAALFQADS